MKTMNPRLFFWLLAGACLALAGCKPQYPKCDKDEHCKEAEFCVNGLCQQCRADADCGAGKTCKGGRCEAILGYCKTAADCPDMQGCVDNRCQTCTTDAHCAPVGSCRNGRCLAAGACFKDEDCSENQECHEGRCTSPPGAGAGKGPCELPTIYFDFNEHVLTSEATGKLNDAVACLKKAGERQVALEGHCDPRGTEAYNLALGDRRAQSVKRHLTRAGAPTKKMKAVSKGKLEARGEDEAGWAMDRKVIFFWK